MTAIGKPVPAYVARIWLEPEPVISDASILKNCPVPLTFTPASLVKVFPAATSAAVALPKLLIGHHIKYRIFSHDSVHFKCVVQLKIGTV